MAKCKHEGCPKQALFKSDFCWEHIQDKEEYKELILQWDKDGRMNLEEAYLMGANLEEANLRGTNLRGANLREAYLRKANLLGADLRGANLGGADLGEANLPGANFGGANLGGANLRKAYLEGAPLPRAYLGEANLREANLREANLRETDLVRANLEETYLLGADLRKAYLVGANLVRANLVGANLGGANLREANLVDANLRGANLVGADLGGANLGGADLERANLREANLVGADLLVAVLRGADLEGATLGGGHLGMANLSEAYLADANLMESTLIEANLSKANLAHADLRNANLNEADLSEAILTGAKVWGMSKAGCKTDGIKAEYLNFDKDGEDSGIVHLNKEQADEFFSSQPSIEILLQNELSTSAIRLLTDLIDKINERNPDWEVKPKRIASSSFSSELTLKAGRDEILEDVANAILGAFKKEYQQRLLEYLPDRKATGKYDLILKELGEIKDKIDNPVERVTIIHSTGEIPVNMSFKESKVEVNVFGNVRKMVNVEGNYYEVSAPQGREDLIRDLIDQLDSPEIEKRIEEAEVQLKGLSTEQVKFLEEQFRESVEKIFKEKQKEVGFFEKLKAFSQRFSESTFSGVVGNAIWFVIQKFALPSV